MQKQQPASRRANRREAGSFAKRGRFWAVTDAAGRLVCLAVYKKGAQEVLRRLAAVEAATSGPKRRTLPRRTQQRIQRGD